MHWRILIILAALLGSNAAAQDREVPYWASMRATEVNMRVGPSADYQIDWVYRRKGMPVRVIRTREGWRLIEDVDGAQGWVVARLLTPERGALVIGDGEAEMRSEPGGAGKIRWRLAPGVVGVLGKCEGQWCELDVQGHKGWVNADRIWGDGEP